MDRTFQRLGDNWLVKWQFLKDVYFLMEHDIRFYSPKHTHGKKYVHMSKHLKNSYGIELNPRQLRYMVWRVKVENRRK